MWPAARYLLLKRSPFKSFRCKEAMQMKPLRKARVGKFTVRALAVLSTPLLLVVLAMLCRSAGAQDPKRDIAPDPQPAATKQPAGSTPLPSVPPQQATHPP